MIHIEIKGNACQIHGLELFLKKILLHHPIKLMIKFCKIDDKSPLKHD